MGRTEARSCLLAAWLWAFAPASASPVVRLGIPALQGRWRKGPQASGEDLVHPIFMLRHDQAALKRMEQRVLEISTPSHPDYGKHMSAEEVKLALPLAAGARAAIMDFLQLHGVTGSSTSLSGDMVSAEVPAPVASAMFGASFYRFTHPETPAELIRASEGYGVPAEIAPYLYMVGNLNEFPHVRSLIAANGSSAEAGTSSFGSDCEGCLGKVTPAVLAEAYQLDAGDVPSNNTNMAVAEFQGVMWNKANLDHFTKQCQLKKPVTVDNQVGDNRAFSCFLQVTDCTEALLDIQYIKAVAGGVPLTDIFNDKYSLLVWAKQLDDLGDKAPAVHSVSYGNDEIQQSGPDYMNAMNVQLMKLAGKGISVLFAAGDQGVWGRTGPSGRFHPDFPASSPYVTAVGGTDFLQPGTIGSEKAWDAGGGGFSNQFATPSWQQQQVREYLATASTQGVLPPEGMFNRSGRAYPDVSALGGQQNPYCVSVTRIFGFTGMTGVAGTSASCPTFAGIIARINSARISHGKPRLGWLNPWLYAHPEMFHDVTNGKNDAGEGHGFAALSGWDPATGLGTPNLKKMLQAALSAEVLVV